MSNSNWIIVAICIVLLIACNKPPAQEEIQSTEKLISCEATLKIIEQNTKGYKIIDIRQYKDYARNHIPGAIHTWRPDYEDMQNEVRGMMADRTKMQGLLRNWGITSIDTLILYDGRGNSNACRLWWILKQYGYEKVKILDGSYLRWQKLNYPTDVLITETVNSSIRLNDPGHSLYANLVDVQYHLKNNGILLDSRTIEEFTGKVKKGQVKRGGRIPTAIRFDWSELVNIGEFGDGTFMDKRTITGKLSGFSIDREDNIIVYCQSGVRSACVTFVLSEIMGYENIRNYDGSWLEWGNSDLPIEVDP